MHVFLECGKEKDKETQLKFDTYLMLCLPLVRVCFRKYKCINAFNTDSIY